MNETLELKSPPRGRIAMSPHEKKLMQQHLRDENLPEAVIPEAIPEGCGRGTHYGILAGSRGLVRAGESGAVDASFRPNPIFAVGGLPLALIELGLNA